MAGPVYPEKLAVHRIAYEIPDAGDRERIDSIIFDELVYGRLEDRSRRYFRGVIETLGTRGCDAVVLGCTEIPSSSPTPARRSRPSTRPARSRAPRCAKRLVSESDPTGVTAADRGTVGGRRTMRLPVIQGTIRRRLLVNFRVDPDVMQAQLPARFSPKLHDGHAIAGICLIRLEAIRPRHLPALVGVSSENAAHRVAVVWTDETGEQKEGVFIPRRDTSSLVNHLGGGRIFPGEHHRAAFAVHEDAQTIDLEMRSMDGAVTVHVRGRFGGELPRTSCFRSLEAASRFFEPGSLGYSVTRQGGRLDGIELRTAGWRVEPLEVADVASSYFSDRSRFPSGSVEFDCALAMRNLAHEWHSADDLYV